MYSLLDICDDVIDNIQYLHHKTILINTVLYYLPL